MEDRPTSSKWDMVAVITNKEDTVEAEDEEVDADGDVLYSGRVWRWCLSLYHGRIPQRIYHMNKFDLLN
jgi:hypothetical protein